MKFVYVSTILCAIAVATSQMAVAQTQYGAQDMPARWMYTESIPMTLPDDDQWWHMFGDPCLDSLIVTACTYNFDALTAIKRIEMANNNLAAARWGYSPTVDASAGYTAQRISGATSSPATAAVHSEYFNLGASVSWDIDVFGRVAAKVKQAKANANISRAEYAGVQVSLAASVASAYINLRTYQAQLAVAQEHIESQQHIVTMTEARHEAGLASMLDVSQAKVVLYSTQATIPGLEAMIETSVNSIATLLGVYPDELPASVTASAPMPQYQQLVGTGVPADLLRRRPDIVQAEYTIAADAAAVGIAKKDFLPTLSLNGTIGTSAHNIGDMFTGRSFTYSVAPTLTWRVFDGMARKYNTLNAQQQMQIDIDNYNSTVVGAVAEVNNAIATYNGALRSVDSYSQVLEQAQKSFDLSVDLYKNSLSSFTNVVDAQMNLITYRNSMISAQSKALLSLVGLYKALGGGWQMPE